MRNKALLWLGWIWLLGVGNVAVAQNYHRIKADFTIKEKKPDSTASLVMGTVYYDKFEKNIVYEVTFPERETWVHADTVVYRLVGGKVKSRQSLPSLMEFTLFHLALNQRLADFGMKNSVFQIEDVKQQEGKVLTTWAPPEALAKQFGNVVVAQQNKRLAGIAVFNTAGTLLSQQVVKSYLQSGNFWFPEEIVQVSHLDNGKKHYRATSFRNLVVNESSNDLSYRPAGLDY
ncbi:hypothetical protein [Catalinimonas alkaloidigena]|nr:hypothetical protein [Catalinimonas alkaloidigena]